nr:unnamed protein product [Digitaria exilis]
MSVVVSKSSPEVIRPPEPLKTTTTVTMRALLVFEHLGSEAIESIKRALSQALVLYYPLAGRIISSGANGDEFSIHCTGEGVEFITASVDYGLQEAKIFGESTGAKALLDELAIFYPAAGSYGSSDDEPLLLLQVTKFSCGGLVLGVTWNHAVADGAGITQFLTAIGELACGSPSPSNQVGRGSLQLF